MRDGPRLIIEQNILYQLLSERAFWDRCPELAELREEGLRVHRDVVTKVLHGKPGCLGCSSLREVLRPFLVRFAEHLAKLHAHDPTSLDRFVAYVSAKRGYRPRPLVVYYRVEGKGPILSLKL